MKKCPTSPGQGKTSSLILETRSASYPRPISFIDRSCCSWNTALQNQSFTASFLFCCCCCFHRPHRRPPRARGPSTGAHPGKRPRSGHHGTLDINNSESYLLRPALGLIFHHFASFGTRFHLLGIASDGESFYQRSCHR